MFYVGEGKSKRVENVGGGMNTHRISIMLIVVGMLFVTGNASSAEEKSPATARLGEVIVTATRLEQEIGSAPAAVNVVTKQEIEERNIKTPDQAVNIVPGVFNRRGKGLMDTQSSVILRGVPDQKRTLVLLDGFPLNDARTGTVNFGGLPLENLERVEVVRGPYSSLYGGYAMGGVVNFITKLPEKREVTLKSGYGSSWHRGEAQDDFVKAYASYGDRVDKWRLFAGYGYQSTNGYPSDFNISATKPSAGLSGWTQTTDNKGATRYLIGDRGDNDWNEYNVTAKVGYELSSRSNVVFSFLRGNYDYSSDDPHTYLRNVAGEPVYSYGSVKEASYLGGYGHRAQNLYQFTWETLFDSVQTKLTVGVNDQDDAWYVTTSTTSAATRSGGPGTKADTPSKGYMADLQITVPLFGKHRLTFGGAFRRNTAETRESSLSNWKDENSMGALTYESKGNDRIYALFVQDEITLLETLVVYLGFRQDWWETYDGYANDVGKAGYPKNYPYRSDSFFSPKGAIVYKALPGTTLRLSGGMAFRPPTVYELYRSYTSGTRTYQYNPDLSPESMKAWDAGVEQKLWQGATVKMTYFENYMKDFIYQRTLSATLSQNENAAKAKSSGVELEAEQRVGKWLRMFANFTYADTRITENPANPNSVDKQVPQVPRRIFSAGGDVQWGKASCNVTGRYVDQRYSTDDNSDIQNWGYGSRESYFVADVKVSYRATDWAKVSLALDNIFNRTYYDYYLAQGRSWFAEVNINF
ncbi:MAG: TonB-dependent receptor [Deltaproteobacteria bacterium]|nr:TonB-dependent receptor [Deltaproteobacteria bacterium]